MSVKLMGAIFDLDIPSAEKLVLLAMADHAREDGTGCYPAIGTLAKKTSLSRRGTQKLIRRLEAAGYIADTGKITRLGTVEYTISLDRGGEQGSLLFALRGANARTKRGEPECTRGANQSAQKGRTGFARTKDLTQGLTKNGTGNPSGGNCQDAEREAVTGADAATTARAFSAFGFDQPFGHAPFRAAVIRRSSELHNGNLVDVMEMVIQDLDSKVPPLFYEAKHAFEKEARNPGEPTQSRTAGADPFPPKDLSIYITTNAAKVRKACSDLSKHRPKLIAPLKKIARSLASMAKSVEKSQPNIESLERKLGALDEELSRLLMEQSGNEFQEIRSRAERDVARYRKSMNAAQVATIEHQMIQKLLLEQFGLPRLSLFYFS
jgi:Helix-turn-helix domain